MAGFGQLLGRHFLGSGGHGGPGVDERRMGIGGGCQHIIRHGRRWGVERVAVSAGQLMPLFQVEQKSMPLPGGSRATTAGQVSNFQCKAQ